MNRALVADYPSEFIKHSLCLELNCFYLPETKCLAKEREKLTLLDVCNNQNKNI